MAKRTPRKVTEKTPIGRDVELSRDVRRDREGRRITGEYAHRVIEASRRPGRPSLEQEDGPSPSIAFRVPASLRKRAEEVAAQEGKSVSALAREALEARLHAS